MRIKKKYYRFFLGLCVVFPVSAISALAMQLWIHGAEEFFLRDWLMAWGRGFLISYPSVIVFVWLGQKILKQVDWQN